MMTKIDQILCFISVVEQHGFTAAARQCSLSPAAVSRKITALETSLGTSLLQRSTRQVQLTPLGEQYYTECKSLLAKLDDINNMVAASQTCAQGTLHVVSNRYFAFAHLLPQLAGFLEANPELKVELEIAERFPDFNQEEVDILFGVSIADAADNLVRKRISQTQYILCAAPAYLEKYGTPKTPHDLQQHHYISHHARKPFDILTFKEAKELYIQPHVSLNDAYAMVDCAIQGIGIVKLHDYMVQDALKSGQLIEILANHKTPATPIYLYYRQCRYLAPKIRRFIDFYAPSL